MLNAFSRLELLIGVVMKTELEKYITPLLSNIKEFRRQLHSYPELGFEETKTLELICNALQPLGLKVETAIGKTGIIAILDTGKPGKTIGIRADFDALSIHEENTFDYASKYKGRMHACGHDGHTAILVCVAGVLAAIKDKIAGKIIFLFQPAEELGEGAKAMLDDEILKKHTIDAIFALHNFPLSPAGHITVKDQCVLAGMDTFEITIEGVAGHASIPEKCLNPISIATTLQVEIDKKLQLIKVEDPISSLSFTSIASNSAESINIIPKKVCLKGITRFSSCETQETMRKSIKNTIDSLSSETGAHINILYQHTCPTAINAEEPTKYLISAVKNELGEERLKLLGHPLAAFDDFAYFLEKIPGCYFFIGNGEDSEMVHTARYDFNDEIILPATKVLTRAVLMYQN